MAVFASCISIEPCAAHLSLHSKFALRPHYVCKYGRHTISDCWLGEEKNIELECGSMPNVMAALPTTGGALCLRVAFWLTPTTIVPCSNADKTRNPLKFAHVPQTRQQISAVSRLSTPYYQHMWRTYCCYCCLTRFFPIVDTCLRSEDMAQQSCAMVPKARKAR